MQNRDGKRRQLSLAVFIEKQLRLNDTKINLNGFELQRNNQRTQDFFKNYIQKRDNELLPFQIKRYTDERKPQIMQQNSQDFIVVEYVEGGKFLDEIDRITIHTFRKIFQQLIHSVFYLHERQILARCISSQNIYIDQFEDKIFLFEFGFSPACPCNSIYKPNHDIKLIIDIMNDLYQKRSGSNHEFLEFKNKMDNLQRQLPTINIIESYFQLYQLVEGSPSNEKLRQVYTEQWVFDMTEKIRNIDFVQPIPLAVQDNGLDSELTDGEQKTRPELQELAITIFEQQYPNEHTQVGLMLLLQSILYQQTYPIQQVNQSQIQKQHQKMNEINDRRTKISNNYQSISEEFRYIIQPNLEEKQLERQKELIKSYCYYTYYSTYKQLFKAKMKEYKNKKIILFTLEEARICLLLIASIERFKSMDIENIYKSMEIQDKIIKSLAILEKYKPQK
ncbi:unnamed protein product (macronuclear) [Paramecium tetraurelia]|uniref:Protein kinase domain-containing protein n=1 Tax=Paramecium tetraurelia TaxID=5888 RepID=A0C1L2_PARTE|nr:uncharacterized protein GSPATT00034156001 [Paramecium tetraurelia]CAK64679.1 unnamed protein product [Paramecium tetraurelia]|eukprot:XP_001432076.1 hypothetical protein (macronuclear) [Paramecium tetraurelia strain d4-2]